MSPESQAQRDIQAENADAHDAFERETAERLDGDTNRQKSAAEELSKSSESARTHPRKSAQTVKKAAKR